ncbi:hypothetical protein A9Q95_02320 [Rhodobacterales bacterium 59_46_T64]|nr:hypothetical protein A9Q95_02320 [Rhodobacterales bacterium 59_46_T64]
MWRRASFLIIAAALAAVPAPVVRAQGLGGAGFSIGHPDETLQNSVAVIDLDRLFLESAFGGRVARDFETRRAALMAENRSIEAALVEEERKLTEDRAGLAPADFRALADQFDEKVQRIRREQDVKVAALGQDNEAAQRLFLRAADPVLTDLMQEIGAGVLIERRYVLKLLDRVDVTALAIERVDAAIGTGGALEEDLDTPQEPQKNNAEDNDRDGKAALTPSAPEPAQDVAQPPSEE